MKSYRSNAAVYVLFLLSGCAALIYEVLWTRQLVLILGGTTYAVTTVIVSFMSGLGLGSHLAGRRSASIRQAGRAYAVLEVAIGAYALLVPVLMGMAEPLYRGLYPNVVELPGLLTAARFCVSALVLIVPTTLMGATFPLLVTHVTRAGLALGRSTALLYGINTCGATLGALLAGFWLIPTFGLTPTTWITAAMNLAIGALGWFVLSGQPQPQAQTQTAAHPAARRKSRKKPALDVAPHPSTANLVLLVAGISGLAAMIYQIAWTRSLIMSIGSSTYSFTCILSAFILGLGAGSLLTARFTDHLRRPVRALAWMEFGIGLSAVLILPVHGRIPSIVKQLVVAHGQDYSQLLALEFMLIVGVTLVPTLLMGAAFPLMARIVGLTHHDPGLVVGRVYVINTLGAIGGAFLAGFVLIRGEVLGIQYTIVAGALANALAAAALLLQSKPPTWTRPRVAITTGLVILAIPLVGLASGKWDRSLLTSAPFGPPKVAPGAQRHILFFREDVETTVAVSREGTDENNLSLAVNGKTDASTNLLDIRTQLLLGYVPALMDRNAKQACIIGLGSGMTLSAIARFPSYERLDCLEISPAVIAGAAFFAPFTHDILTADPRVRLIRADGRNHLLLTAQQYDLIVSEPSNPWIAGVSSLFSREFFEVCKRRLRPEGVLAVWTHSYSMSADDFKMIVRTLGEVFDAVSLWELADADYCLVAGNQPFGIPLATLMERYSRPDVRADLYRAGIRDLGGLLGTFVTAGQPLRDWAASAPVNTDDNSRLEFSAPRHLYDDQVLDIADELNRLQGSPLDQVVIVQPDDPGVASLKERIAAVVHARHGFMRGLREWRAGQHTQGLGRLMEGYDRDPGNVLIAFVLSMVVQSTQSMATIPAVERESLRPLLDRAMRLPRPVVAPPRGATIPQIVAWSREAVQECLDRKEFALAAGYLQQALNLVPDDGSIACNLALALLQAGRPDQAESAIGQFLRNYPEDGWANYAAGRLAIFRGNHDLSLTHLEKALKSGAVRADWLAKIPDLEPLRKDDRLARLLERFPTSQPQAH